MTNAGERDLGDISYIDSLGTFGQCFHKRAEAGWITEAAQPHEKSPRRDANYTAVYV